MKLFIVYTVKGAKHIVMAESIADAKSILCGESQWFNGEYDGIKSVLEITGNSIRVE